MELKKELVNKEDLIKAITDKNENFSKRFEFSKMKILKKKEKKYKLIFKVEKCNYLNLSMYFLEKNNNFVFNREDYVGLFLNSIHPNENSKVLLYESSKGLILSALIDKI